MIRYAEPAIADAAALTAVADRSFTATFAHLYPPETLRHFLAEQFRPAAQIGEAGWRYRAAWEGDQMLGYAKLGPLRLPVDAVPTGALELHQLYLLPEAHGCGIAQALMAWVLAEARGAEAPALFLSVYVDNHRARRFYARYGFREVGRYGYRVGDHIDDDRILRLDL